MAEIMAFPDPADRRLIWVCNCGCTVHRAYADGEIRCADCDTAATADFGEWRQRLPDAPESPKEVGPENFKVVTLDSAETFLKRRLLEGCGGISVVIVVHADGGMATYAEEHFRDERAEWLHEQLAIAEARLTKPPELR